MTIFFAFILVTSILGFALNGVQNTNKNIYNKHEFVQKNNLWTTEINDNEIEFVYYPDTTLDINFSDTTYEPLITYIVSNPQLNHTISDLQSIDYAKYELRNTFEKLGYENNNLGFNIKYNNQEAINCNKSTSTIYVINLEIGNTTNIQRKNNCFTLTGTNGAELLRAKDRLVYGVVKII